MVLNHLDGMPGLSSVHLPMGEAHSLVFYSNIALLMHVKLGPTRDRKTMEIRSLYTCIPCEVDRELSVCVCHCSHSVRMYHGGNLIPLGYSPGCRWLWLCATVASMECLFAGLWCDLACRQTNRKTVK
jgi:hypothetical protein